MINEMELSKSPVNYT